MTRNQARETARDILHIVPLVMRTVAAELRANGELPAPAHFGLLSILSERQHMLTDLAAIQGVSLPTMSNSISAMVDRGWVRRTAPGADRRVVMIEVTAAGRAALERVARAAETHLAVVLAPLDVPSRRRLHGGLDVLRRVFAAIAGAKASRAACGPLSKESKVPAASGTSRTAAMSPTGHRTTAKRRAYVSQ